MTSTRPRCFGLCFGILPALASLVFPAAAVATPFEDALCATVKLVKGDVAGSGFLVKGEDGNVRIASAAHVFHDLKGESCTVVLRKKEGENPSSRMEIALAIREGEKALWTQHEKHDLAVIPFEMPKEADLKPFEHEQIALAEVAEKGVIGVGLDVCIPCYPVKTEANESGWPILRRGTIATHPLAPLSVAETFFVDSASFGGESGAPVVAWQGEDALVIGVIVSMQRQTDRTKTPLEERVSHMPLGLGIAVQSPFLRDLLE